MPAKAMVPVNAFPSFTAVAPPTKASVPVEALLQHPPLSGPRAPPATTADSPPIIEMGHVSVGAGHARESDGSG
jgi:hypothetical protein